MVEPVIDNVSSTITTIECERINNVELIDAVKRSFGLVSDADLARHLGITRGGISTIRRFSKPLNDHSKLIIMDMIGFLGINNWSERISTPYIADILGLKVDGNSSGISDRDLPDQIKLFLKLKSDDELANLLGLKRHAISMVRTGKSLFGVRVKLKLLKLLEGTDTDMVISMLDNVGLLISAVNDFNTLKKSNK